MRSKNKRLANNSPSHVPDPFAALRFRDYRLFMIGRVFLFAGYQMRTVAVGWELYERTGSSLLMLTASGAFDNISVVIRQTLVQIRTPDHLRGRVSAMNGVFISASNELGGFESGLTSALFGPIVSVVGGGIGTIVVAIAIALIFPKIRQLGALHEYR